MLRLIQRTQSFRDPVSSCTYFGHVCLRRRPNSKSVMIFFLISLRFNGVSPEDRVACARYFNFSIYAFYKTALNQRCLYRFSCHFHSVCEFSGSERIMRSDALCCIVLRCCAVCLDFNISIAVSTTHSSTSDWVLYLCKSSEQLCTIQLRLPTGENFARFCPQRTCCLALCLCNHAYDRKLHA